MNFKKASKDLAILTAVVVAIQVFLSKVVYPLIPGVGVTQNVFSITPQTALTSTNLGDKIIGVLAGIVNFNLGNLTIWVSMLIGTFLLLMAGYFIYEKLPRSMQGNDIYWRLGLILLYGTAVLYVVLLLTKGNVSAIGMPLAIGLLVNYAAIAMVVGFLAKTKFGKIIGIRI